MDLINFLSIYITQMKHVSDFHCDTASAIDWAKAEVLNDVSCARIFFRFPNDKLRSSWPKINVEMNSSKDKHVEMTIETSMDFRAVFFFRFLIA